MIEACAQLPVELDIVEGVPHDEARERYARADIVVDQLNAGWHGVFALEAMALGKPVVTLPEAGRRRAERRGLRRPHPDRAGDEGDARRRARARSSRARRSAARSAPRAAPTSSRCTTSTASPTACSTSTVRSRCVARLPAPAARAPVGDLRPRRDPLAHPRGASAAALHRRTSARGLRQDRDVTALTTVLVIVLRLGISSAFFRFYFDSKDAERAADVVVRTSFWFTMAMATLGLVARLSRSRRRSRTCSGSATTRGSCAPAPSGSGRR